MAIQTFTAGQVLTAAQMNSLQANDYNQTVSTKTVSYTLVAADKGTRVIMNAAGATTITINTGIFAAGDTLILQNIGAGTCTVTAGTATVASAGPLAIPQNGSGTLYFTSTGVSIYFPSAVTATASALTLISATTIGNAVSSTTVSNAFSATYDAYKITVSGGSGSTFHGIKLQLGSTTTGYYSGVPRVLYTGGASNHNDNNASAFTAVGAGNTDSLNVNLDLINPFLSKNTFYYATQVSNDTTAVAGGGGGFLNNSTSYTAFTISPVSGTHTGGTIRVYGYANS